MAWKKNRQGAANARKRRSRAKDIQKISPKNFDDADTSSYVFHDPGNCDNLKLVFFKNTKIKKHQTDTLILGFRQPENEISENDEVAIRDYLLKNPPDLLIKIKLCDCDIASKHNEVHRSFYLKRALKASDYLKEKNIPTKMIELE